MGKILQSIVNYLLKVSFIFVVYFLAARFGLGISPVSGFATLVWPPTGIALVALFIWGWGMWPGVFLAAFLVNSITGAPPLGAFGIALGNSLEAVVGSLLLKRVGFSSNLEKLSDVAKLVGIAVVFSTAISAVFGVTSLVLVGLVSMATYIPTLIAWWVGDALGNLIVAPFLFLWLRRFRLIIGSKRVLEFLLVLAILVVVCVFVFTGLSLTINAPSLIYLIFPPLMWLAIRFGQKSSTLLILLVSVIAVWGTVSGYGPFMGEATSQALLQLQLFMGTFSISIMVLGAVVAERKKAEDSLLEINSKLESYAIDLEKANTFIEQEKAKDEALLSSVGDGVIATDQKGEVIFMNKAAERMLGFSAKDFNGKKMVEILKIEDTKSSPVPIEKRPFHRALTTGTVISDPVPYLYTKKDGTKLPVMITTSPVVLNGKIIGAMDVFRDMTQEMRLDKAKSEFISVASHQLRTPVKTLISLTKILKSDFEKLSKDSKSHFNKMTTSVDWLSRLVENLLNISQLESGTVKAEKKNIDLIKFTESFIKDITAYASVQKHKLILKNNLKGAEKTMSDPKLLYNILQNFVANAIEYSPSSEDVVITLETVADEIKISVSHGGPVIPKEEQDKLFQKFYRGDTGKIMRPEGAGLGLYIVKTSSDLLGGKVGFESEEGKDTVFWFTFPKS